MIRFVLRSILALYIVCSFFAGPLWAAIRRSPPGSLDLIKPVRHCRWAARLFNWRLRWLGERRPRSGLVVMNHQSWIDPLLLLAAHMPLRFITSVEVERTPFLGDVSRQAGCLFIERRQARAAVADCRLVATCLRRSTVVLFPEATSTNGERVVPFRGAFFQSAIDADVAVHPFAFRYLRIDDRPLSKANRDRVCWYGDMTFLPHLLGLLRTRRVDAAVMVAAPLQAIALPDRRRLAEEAHRRVSAMYQRLAHT